MPSANIASDTLLYNVNNRGGSRVPPEAGLDHPLSVLGYTYLVTGWINEISAGPGVAIDAIGVFVQESNPLQSLSVDQLDRLFSATRYCTFGQPINYWHELLDDSEYSLSDFAKFPEFPVQLFGRNSASGTYSYFKQKALCHGDYRNTVKQLSSSASIIHTVANRMGGIGYASLGSTIPGVKALSIANGGKEVEVNAKTVQSGQYPLARQLYLLVNQILADYQYKDAFVADHELNLVACMTEVMANVEIK